MGLPPVDSVEVVKPPEPEKGRDRVRRPGERRRPRWHANAGKPGGEQAAADSSPLPEDEIASSQPDGAQAPSPVDSAPEACPEPVERGGRAPSYGPAADVHEEEPEHHHIDYRA